MSAEGKIHADGDGGGGTEAELCVEVFSGTVGEEADVGTGGRGGVEVLDEAADDGFAEPAPLMLRVNGDVDDLEGQATVADDTAHADETAGYADGDGEEGVGKADGGAFGAFGAEAREHTELPVFVWRGSVEEEVVPVS